MALAQILYGTTLADKLVRVVDDPAARGPRAPVPVPDLPGRPPELAPVGARETFPRDFGSPVERARMLHFLANHELLALELIALALLRFPDAEPGWRRGMIAILGQEQDHFAGYLARLDEAGLAFGSRPLNRYFWTALSGAPSPQHFTAGLALTFEQANLDHAAAFAARFRAVGDLAAAAHMDRVLADEIQHVAHGVRWLGTWRPGVDLWSAWTGLLVPPLTPARAKGERVLDAPRLAAGIPQATVDRLRTWSASRGRPPVIGWFRPDVESELVRNHPTPGKAERVGADLATLPMFLLGADDHVLAPEPGVAWLSTIQAAGFTLPGFGLEVPERAAGWLPWGWSPGVCARAGVPWDPRWRELYSKAWLQAEHGEGRVARDGRELAELGGPGCVLKAPFSTAGRGLMRWEQAGREGWAARVLAEQGALVVEPWEERVMDLSVQIDVGRAPWTATERGLPSAGVGGPVAVKIHPWARFATDARGRYLGAWLGQPLRGLDNAVLRWLRNGPELDPGARGAAPEPGTAGARPGSGWLQAELERAIRPVVTTMIARGFRGPAGVDAYVARTATGLRLRPLVELNPRVTMGRIAMAVGRHVRRDRPAMMRIITPGRLAAEGLTVAEWIARMQALPAPELQDGLIARGTLALTEPRAERGMWVVLEVGSP